MKTSQKGIDLIKHFEGCRLVGYPDFTGIATIGYGHTRVAKIGWKITEEAAEKLLVEDLTIIEAQLNKLNLDLTQNQFDAVVSFVFNLGIGNFSKSTLLKKIKQDQTNFDIAFEFIKWTRAGRTILPGLELRRKAEAKLYFTGRGVNDY